MGLMLLAILVAPLPLMLALTTRGLLTRDRAMAPRSLKK
jgi:hypothetical protein